MATNKQQQRLIREARKAQEAASKRRQRLRRLLITVAIIVAIAAAVAWGVWAATRPKPGVAYPDQGRAHIYAGERHPPYNSNPPTSGWHLPAPAAWGFYANELPDELVVHNLEHGGIWISYKNPNDSQLTEKLEALARRFPVKVIITVRPKNDSPIAVAAWGRLLTLDHYDEQQTIAFINAFKNKGPEQVPDM